MGQEADWRDLKQECPQSVTRGTHIGALVGLIEQLGDEHRVFLAKIVANLFPFAHHHEEDIRREDVISLQHSEVVIYLLHHFIQVQGGAT